MAENKCPHCDQELPFANASYCDLCGKQLPQGPVRSWAPISLSTSINFASESDESQELKVCTNCQHENLGQANYCAYCGTKLS